MSKSGFKTCAAAWQPTSQAASQSIFTARPFPEIVQREQETAGYGGKAAPTVSRPGMIENINREMARNPIPDSNVDIPGVRAKLTIGEPGDRYEQEADRVAADVVQRMNNPTAPSIKAPEREDGVDKSIQRKPVIPITAGMPAPREDIQRKGQIVAGNVPDLQANFEKQINQARGGGSPLDEAFRAKIEPAMGADFSGVRVHTDAKADQMSQSIQAKAFTTGQDVFFRQGTYDPGSRGGQELLAHELTHVVQQNGGVVMRSQVGGVRLKPFDQPQYPGERTPEFLSASMANGEDQRSREQRAKSRKAYEETKRSQSGLVRTEQSRMKFLHGRSPTHSDDDGMLTDAALRDKAILQRKVVEEVRADKLQTVQTGMLEDSNGGTVVRRLIDGYKPSTTLHKHYYVMKGLDLAQMKIVQELHDDPLRLYDRDEARRIATGQRQTSNPYEWEVRSGGGSYAVADQGQQEVLDNFGHPTQDVVKKYSDLADRIQFEVGRGRDQKLLPQTEYDLHQVMEATKPLHFSFNQFLSEPWKENMDSYGGKKKEIQLYNVMRSSLTKDFVGIPIQGFGNMNDVLKTVSGRPPEVHHLLYKALHPKHACDPRNLMLTERSASEEKEGPGQHELMHKIFSGNYDKFKALLPQTEQLYTEWIEKETGHKLI